MRKQHGGGVRVMGGGAGCGGDRRGKETPLQEVDVCGRICGGLGSRRVSGSGAVVIGGLVVGRRRAGQGQDELGVFLRVLVDAVVGIDGDNGAEGERVGSVAEAP